MNIGVGLPNTVPGTNGEVLVEWARLADEGPFSSLAVLDRLLYDSYESMTALAASAAVARSVRLASMIVIAPLRNTAFLAKQAASIDAMSGGRLTLGLAVGARDDDYDAAGVEHRGKGKRFSRQLAELREIWESGQIGPPPAQENGPELLVGGLIGPAFDRMARYADGYAHNGGPPRAFARAAASANAAWSEIGRPGRPQLWGQAYFALGDEEEGNAYLRDYYAFTGPFAEKIVAGNLTSPRAIRDLIRGYEEEGCDELVLLPTVPRIEQLERLAEVLA